MTDPRPTLQPSTPSPDDLLCTDCGHHIHGSDPCEWTFGAGMSKRNCPCGRADSPSPEGAEPPAVAEALAAVERWSGRLQTASGRYLASWLMPWFIGADSSFDEDAFDVWCDHVAEVEREAALPEPSLDVPAMAETLRFLYHADEPCDAPNKHRHEHIAAGIVGQYPRFAARFLKAAAARLGTGETE